MCTMRVMLCIAVLAACAIYTVSEGKFTSCCTRVSIGKPKADTIIENFIIQNEDLPCVHAVMFITNDGKIMCSTPSARWVKLKIQEIVKKNEQQDKLNEKED